MNSSLQLPARSEPRDFTLTDSNGNSIKLSDYKGKVVLLDFWARWCTGCKQEISWYMEFAKKYGRSGLAVIGVSTDQEGWTVVKPFIQEKRRNQVVWAIRMLRRGTS